MKLNFLDSGIDSLKKGFQNLIEYEKITFFNPDKISEGSRFYFLKDSILFIQHGIEILFKNIIQNHSEYLIFSQIDSNVKNAIQQKNSRKLNSVFETDLKHKIHTVTFLESIERLKIIPGVSISSALVRKLKDLESYRNIIMHSEPYLNEYEINQTFEGLSDELDLFFYENIGKKYQTISGYSELNENFESFKNLLAEKGMDLKIKSVEVILKGLKKAKISIGGNEVKRITDINVCSKFLDELFNSDLKFGTDLYNGFCSGSVSKVKRKDGNIFEIFTDDNETFYEFKLKSIIIYIPQINDDKSPIIFIESDNLDYSEKNYPDSELNIFDNIESLHYLKSKENQRLIYNNKEVIEILEDENFEYDNYDDYYRFFTQGLFCFLNFQGLEYNSNYKSFIWKRKTMDGKQFEVVLREALQKKLLSIT